jgi:hypothetical protein
MSDSSVVRRVDTSAYDSTSISCARAAEPAAATRTTSSGSAMRSVRRSPAAASSFSPSCPVASPAERTGLVPATTSEASDVVPNMVSIVWRVHCCSGWPRAMSTIW